MYKEGQIYVDALGRCRIVENRGMDIILYCWLYWLYCEGFKPVVWTEVRCYLG